MRVALFLFLALTTAVPATAVECPHWLLRVRAYFEPREFGPKATFEGIKQEIGRRLSLSPLVGGSTELAKLVESVLVKRMATQSSEVQAKIWAQVLGAPLVDSRTGLVGGLQDGSRSRALRQALAVLDDEGACFWNELHHRAIGALAAMHSGFAWSEMAWALAMDGGAWNEFVWTNLVRGSGTVPFIMGVIRAHEQMSAAQSATAPDDKQIAKAMGMLQTIVPSLGRDFRLRGLVAGEGLEPPTKGL